MKIYAVSPEARATFNHYMRWRQAQYGCPCRLCFMVTQLIRTMPDRFRDDCQLGREAGLLQGITAYLKVGTGTAAMVWINMGYKPALRTVIPVRPQTTPEVSNV